MRTAINSTFANGETPLTFVASNYYDSEKGVREAKQNDIAKVLLEYGAYANVPNSKGETPLRIAKRKGNEGLVRILKNAGARE